MIHALAFIGLLTIFVAVIVALSFLAFWIEGRKAKVRTQIPKAWLRGIADGRRR